MICGGIGNFPKGMMPSVVATPTFVALSPSQSAVQKASGGFDMMKEHFSGHISLIWRRRKPQPSKIKKGMSAFALYLLKPAEFKLWDVLNSKTMLERIWGNTTVFVIFAVLWQSCSKTLFFYYISFLKNVSAMGQFLHSARTIVSQAAGPLARFSG